MRNRTRRSWRLLRAARLLGEVVEQEAEEALERPVGPGLGDHGLAAVQRLRLQVLAAGVADQVVQDPARAEDLGQELLDDGPLLDRRLIEGDALAEQLALVDGAVEARLLREPRFADAGGELARDLVVEALAQRGELLGADRLLDQAELRRGDAPLSAKGKAAQRGSRRAERTPQSAISARILSTSLLGCGRSTPSHAWGSVSP